MFHFFTHTTKKKKNHIHKKYVNFKSIITFLRKIIRRKVGTANLAKNSIAVLCTSFCKKEDSIIVWKNFKQISSFAKQVSLVLCIIIIGKKCHRKKNKQKEGYNIFMKTTNNKIHSQIMLIENASFCCP